MGALAARDERGIAHHQADAVERHAEPLGDDLGERRLVALAVIVGAAAQLDHAVRPDLDRAPLERRAGGDLDVVGDAAPAQPAA